jgi:hypothetical protein
MDWLLDILFGWLYDVLYILQKSICVVIDFIVDTFHMLSGLTTVTADGKQTDLLSHFIQSEAVRTAFLGVLLIGVILLCIFVMIAIIRSEYADAQHKRAKGQILVKAGHSFIIFLLIPVLLAAGILLTNTVMAAVSGSMLAGVSDGGRTLFGGQILATSGYNAYTGDPSMRGDIERMFLTGELDYNNMGVVKQYYDLTEMNFFIGVFSGLILLILFALAAIRFVQRLFDVILLYVLSPASVATIPLDDGARMRLWREMLISKILSAYGIVLAMNLFFLIVPQINRIRFYDNGFQNGLIGLLFIIGGAFAVTKAYAVIAQLTGGGAGMQETQQTMAGIYSGIRMAKGTVRGVTGAVGQLIGGSDFRTNRRRGAGFGENVSASVHGSRNRRAVNTDGYPVSKGGKNSGKGFSEASGYGMYGSKGQAAERYGGASKPNADTGEHGGGTYSGAAGEYGEAMKPADMVEHGGSTAGVTDAGQAMPANARALDNENVRDKHESDTSIPLQTAAHIAGGAGRLSGLPVGFVKDLLQGGVITAGKNMWPRIRNVVKGRGIINHADIVRKPPQDTAAGKGVRTLGTENASALKSGAAKPDTANMAKPDTNKSDTDKKNNGGTT